jgi:hypothetical protein
MTPGNVAYEIPFESEQRCQYCVASRMLVTQNSSSNISHMARHNFMQRGV